MATNGSINVTNIFTMIAAGNMQQSRKQNAIPEILGQAKTSWGSAWSTSERRQAPGPSHETEDSLMGLTEAQTLLPSTLPICREMHSASRHKVHSGGRGIWCPNRTFALPRLNGFANPWKSLEKGLGIKGFNGEVSGLWLMPRARMAMTASQA